MGLKVLSLFDGMSCGRIALEKLGLEVDKYFSSEIKPHAIKVTQENYPDTIQLGDINKLEYKDGILYSENGKFYVGEIDLLIGGSPCQNFSVACIPTKRLGLNGDKSKLFYEYLRIMKEVNPKYYLLENVGSMKKSDQSSISEYLNQKPVNINSSYFTGQLRNRLYWTNLKVDEDYEDKGILFEEVLTEGYTNRKKSKCLMEGDSRPLTTPVKMFHRYTSTGLFNIVFKSKEHFEQCKAHYDKYYKGKSALEITKMMDYMDNSVYEGIRVLNKIEMERLQTVPEGYTNSITRNQAASLMGDGWTVDVIAHIFKSLKEEYGIKEVQKAA